MHKEFKSRYEPRVVPENIKWIYQLSLGERKLFMGENLEPFELTEENIQIFNQGVEIISL